MNSLKDIGEFGFIESFSHKFDSLLYGNEIGIGDDCAVFQKDNIKDNLFTTDLLVEGIHFIREKISPFNLGYKSVAVNLSDIAAMGGDAVGTFLSIAVPPTLSTDFLDEFMSGYLAVSKEFNVPLLGGDTTKSLRDFAINVGVVGEIERGKAKMRSYAEDGDIICVTGYLGDSAGGLQIVLNETDRYALEKLASVDSNADYLLKRHYLPKPRLFVGSILRNFRAVHAMMDISDGIGSDLRHILRMSNKSAVIEIDKIPISTQLRSFFVNENDEFLYDMAITGGEDYELLVTVSADEFDDINRSILERTGQGLFAIGRISNNDCGKDILWRKNGSVLDKDFGGFNHFKG